MTASADPDHCFLGAQPPGLPPLSRLASGCLCCQGPLTTALENILQVIRRFEKEGRENAEGQVLGYENFRPRQLVNELLLERRHLAAILRAFGLGVLELNRDGRIVMVNARACEVLEEKEGLLVGELFSSLFPHSYQSGVQEILTDLVRSPEPAHFQTKLHLGGVEIPIRMAAIVEEKECTGLLVTLEEKESRPEGRS